MNNRFLLLFFSITIAINVSSQSLNLSLEEAKQQALSYNKQLNGVRAKREIAKQKFNESLCQGLPQVSATVDYTDFFNYEMEFGLGGGSASTPNINYNVLDAGDTEILKLFEAMSGGDSPTKISMKNQATAQLQISQLLFSGQYITGVQLSKIARLIAETTINKSEIDVKESVINSYISILIAEEFSNIIDGNLVNIKETLKQTSGMISAGMIEPIDADQLQMTITILENKKRAILRNIELSYNVFKIQLGINTEQTIKLTDNLNSLLSEADILNLLNNAFELQSNVNYQLLDGQEKIAKKMVDMQKWSYAPDLVAAYNRNEKIITTDFDMTPKNLITLRLNVPIFSSGVRKSKVEQKKIELYQVRNSKDLLEDNLLMQNKQLRYNLLSALEDYNSQKSNVLLAKKVYVHTEKKFRHGVSSSIDLTQANSNYLQAENNYISTLLELLQAKLSFEKLLNKL